LDAGVHDAGFAGAVASFQGFYSNLEFQETLEKPGIFKQVKNLEITCDLEPNLENQDFVLQIA